MWVAVFIFLQFLHLSSAVELKVGIYNYIPDLGEDNLASYKAMIENGFKSTGDHTVDAVVDEVQYNPYSGNLNYYLSLDGFDLIEMDTANLKQIVEEGLVTKVETLPDDIMPAAVSAVTVDGHMYGYPTLLCGNFLFGLAPGDDTNCPLRSARSNYNAFHDNMEVCKTNLVHEPSQRLIGGKMNDNSGWYLSLLYIDGYIDIHGTESVERAIDEVTRGVVDQDVCERLTWYISFCSDADGGAQKNKCYYNLDGSYVESRSNVYGDIKSGKTVLLFGYSEMLARVVKDNPSRKPYAAISGPLGSQNHPIQFTDALVINKARWTAANEEKRNAILSFVDYFLSNNVRNDIAMGNDVNPHQVRYILPATKTFYESTTDSVYLDLFWSLQRAVAAPSLTDGQKKKMKEVLEENCTTISQTPNGIVSSKAPRMTSYKTFISLTASALAVWTLGLVPLFGC